ncbi:MAG: hypothetical protein ACYC6L_08130, partial [Anaerolineae bacterium]
LYVQLESPQMDRYPLRAILSVSVKAGKPVIQVERLQLAEIQLPAPVSLVIQDILNALIRDSYSGYSLDSFVIGQERLSVSGIVS